MTVFWMRVIPRERGAKWLHFRHNLKVKPIDFVDRFQGGIREGKVKDNAKILG